MATLRHLISIICVILLIDISHCQVTFGSLCSSEATVAGMSSIDGNDEFEIDLYEPKFLPDDTILCKKKFRKDFHNKISYS
jgi:hypothetical protein